MQQVIRGICPICEEQAQFLPSDVEEDWLMCSECGDSFCPSLLKDN